MPNTHFKGSKRPLPKHWFSSISTRKNRWFCRPMQAALQSPASFTSTTDSGFFAQSISTLENALLPNRTTTRRIGSSCWLSRQYNNGDTISRAPITRSWSSATTRTSSTSKPPKCSLEDRPGGRKFYPLMTLSSNTWNERRTRQMDHQEDPTTRLATRDRPHDYWRPWQLSPFNRTMTSFKKSKQLRLSTRWLPTWITALSALKSSISLTCKE